MSIDRHEPHARFGEPALRALFEDVEPPAGLENSWRDRAVAGPSPGSPAVRARRRSGPRRTPTGPSWRVAAAAVVTMAVVAGVVIAGRLMSTEPEPADPPTISVVPQPSPPRTVSSGAPTTTSSGTGSSAPPPAGPAPAGTATPPPTTTTRTPDVAVPPLVGWPSSANTGVPVGTMLRQQFGDLHVTTPGAVISNLRVDGTIHVEAADVTLRAVQVHSPYGVPGVRQQAGAPRLTVELSEVGLIQQSAAGLTVRRSEAAIAVLTDVSAVDCVLDGISTSGNASRIVLRHNTIRAIQLYDQAGPVTDVTVERNLLGSRSEGVVIAAPVENTSHHIEVLSNEFTRAGYGTTDPVSGWNAQAQGNVWTGNVWSDNRQPISP